MLVDVFGQTFVMLFPLGGWLLSPKQLQLADEMDFLVLLEIILFIDGLVSPIKPLSFCHSKLLFDIH